MPEDELIETLHKGHAIRVWYDDLRAESLCELSFDKVRMLVYGVPRCRKCREVAENIRANVVALAASRRAFAKKK